MDNLKYTKMQLEKHWSLIEDHFLWASWNKKESCYECVWFHIVKLEGYCEEGLKFDKDVQKYEQMFININILKDELYVKDKTDYIKYALISREMKRLVWENKGGNKNGKG